MSWWLRILVGAGIVGLSIAASVWLAREQASETTTASTQLIAAPSAPLAVILDAGAGDAGETEGPPGHAHPLSLALCPLGMNWVGGDYCPTGAVRADHCAVEPRGVEFCIDQHEYPNQVGVLPSVMVSFDEAAHYCAQEGKRLCSEGEWTFACRGTRKLAACNYGRETPRLHSAAFWDPSTVASVLAANEGRRSSAESECQSPWGVFDLLGNVDEWAASEHVHGYAAAIKGGRYNQSSIGCERSFQTRKADLRYPRTGFRCCSDPLVRIPEVP